jgi:disulfide bond formation protein DsbB
VGASCSETVVTDNDASVSVVVPGDPLAGATGYRAVCATCHGIDLAGVAGLGRSLVPSSYVVDQSHEDLIAFIIEGRPIDHPDNITGVAMLPRGGNPSLRDQDISNIVAYIKAQQ